MKFRLDIWPTLPHSLLSNRRTDRKVRPPGRELSFSRGRSVRAGPRWQFPLGIIQLRARGDIMSPAGSHPGHLLSDHSVLYDQVARCTSLVGRHDNSLLISFGSDQCGPIMRRS
jgi:hypothetical protein